MFKFSAYTEVHGKKGLMWNHTCHMKCISATCYHTTNTWNHTIYMHQHNNYVKLHHIHASTQQLHENTPSTCIHTTTTWNHTIHMNTQVRHFYPNSLEPQQSIHNLFGLYNFFNKSKKISLSTTPTPILNPSQTPSQTRAKLRAQPEPKSEPNPSQNPSPTRA